MSNLKDIGRLVLAVGLGIATALAPLATYAQEDSQPKKKKPRKIELDKIYQRWVNEDVDYIITPEERAAFKKNFRPTKSARNSSSSSGCGATRTRTRRKMSTARNTTGALPMPMKSSPPAFPAGRRTGGVFTSPGGRRIASNRVRPGPYERPIYEGGGTTSTYPFEIWFYRYLEGVGSGIEIEFVDPTGSGEYRIARNADEKDALLFVPNAGLTLAEQLGLASKVDRPFFNPGNRYGNNPLYPMRTQDMPFERLAILTNLQRAPSVRYRQLAERVDQQVEFDVLPFDVRTDFLRAGESAIVTTFTLMFNNGDLGFKDEGGIQKAQLNIYARVSALTGKRVGIFEEAPIITYQQSQFEVGRKLNSVYQKSLILPPGNYKIDFVVRDVTSGHTGIVRQGFEVPRYSPEALSTSSLILADLVEPVTRVSGSQFIIGANKVRPSVTQRFKQNQSLGVYMQVYNVQIDQASLRPAIEVEYVITNVKTGQEVQRIREDGKNGISDLSGYGQQIVLGRLIPLEKLEPGSYEVTVVVTDKVARKTLTPKTFFTVEPAKS